MISAPGSPVPEIVTSETSSALGTTNWSPSSGSVIVTSALASRALGPTVALASSMVVARVPGRIVTMTAVSEKTPGEGSLWLLTVTVTSSGRISSSAGVSTVVTGAATASTVAPRFVSSVSRGVVRPSTSPSTPPPSPRPMPSSWTPVVWPSRRAPTVVFTVRTLTLPRPRLTDAPPVTLSPRTAVTRASFTSSTRPPTSSATASPISPTVSDPRMFVPGARPLRGWISSRSTMISPVERSMITPG